MPTLRLQFVRTDTTYGRQGAVEGADHIGDRDVVGGAGEQPTAITPAHAPHEFTVAKLAQDVEQESGRHVVAFRQHSAGDGLARVVEFERGDRGHHANAVVDFVRDPHSSRPYQP